MDNNGGIHGYSHISDNQTWRIDSHGEVSVADKDRSFLGRLWDRVRGRTELGKIFHKMSNDIDGAQVTSKQEVKDLVDLTAQVENRFAAFATKTGRAGAAVAGHGDIAADKDHIVEQAHRKLGALFFGDPDWKTDEPITEDEQQALDSLYTFLNNTNVTSDDIEQFEDVIQNQFPELNGDGLREMYNRMAALEFPTAQLCAAFAANRDNQPAEALHLLNLAAGNGSQLAASTVEIVARRANSSEALVHAHKLAKQQAEYDPTATIRVATDHLLGHGTEIDLLKARDLAETISTNQELDPGQRRLGTEIKFICDTLLADPNTISKSDLEHFQNNLSRIVKSENKRTELISNLAYQYPVAAYLHAQKLIDNPKETFHLNHLAATKGLAAAQISVSAAYRNGDGVIANPQEAVRWLGEAQERDIKARLQIGRDLASGYGGVKQPGLAKQIFQHIIDDPDSAMEDKNAARQGLIAAEGARILNLATRFDNLKMEDVHALTYTEGFRNLENFMDAKGFTAEQKGYATAGFMYENGIGVETNLQLAKACYDRSGLPDAVYEDGYQVYEQGDYPQALIRLEQAAKMGQPDAAYTAVRIHELGLAGAENPERALDLIQNPFVPQTADLLRRRAELTRFDMEDLEGSVPFYQQAADAGSNWAAVKLLNLIKDELISEDLFTEEDIARWEAMQSDGFDNHLDVLADAAALARSGGLPPIETLDALRAVTIVSEVPDLLREHLEALEGQNAADVAAELRDNPPVHQHILANLGSLMTSARATETTAEIALETAASYLFETEEPTDEQLEVMRGVIQWAADNRIFFQAEDALRVGNIQQAQETYAALANQGDTQAFYPAGRLLDLGVLGPNRQADADIFYKLDKGNSDPNCQYQLGINKEAEGKEVVTFGAHLKKAFELGSTRAAVQIYNLARRDPPLQINQLSGDQYREVGEMVIAERARLREILEDAKTEAERGNSTNLNVIDTLEYVAQLSPDLTESCIEQLNALLRSPGYTTNRLNEALDEVIGRLPEAG